MPGQGRAFPRLFMCGPLFCNLISNAKRGATRKCSESISKPPIVGCSSGILSGILRALPAWVRVETLARLFVNPPTHNDDDGHTPLTPLTRIGAMKQTADSDPSRSPGPRNAAMLHMQLIIGCTCAAAAAATFCSTPAAWCGNTQRLKITPTDLWHCPCLWKLWLISGSTEDPPPRLANGATRCSMGDLWVEWSPALPHIWAKLKHAVHSSSSIEDGTRRK